MKTLIAFVSLVAVGLHLCVYFSSWPHHQGDTWFLVCLMDTFGIAALSVPFIAVALDLP